MTEPLPLLIVTYFEPFEGRSRNRSEELARELAERSELLGRFSGIRLCRLPVVYDVAPRMALDCIRTPEPGLGGPAPWVLSRGDWSGESLSIETAAHNLDHSPHLADNAGETRTERPIIPGAEPSLEFRFPMTPFLSSPILSALSPRISPSAGGFLCNHLAYHLTRTLGQEGVPFLFVHTGHQDSRSPKLEAAALAEGLLLASAGHPEQELHG